MAKKPPFEKVKAEYRNLFAGASVRASGKPEVRAVARRIIDNRPRYAAVSKATGVPWFVIGLLHNMECSLSFEKHLHNGDRLADKEGNRLKTQRKPRGRGPFGSWEESAADALRIDGLDKVDWSKDVVERIAYMAETFNGWGYRNESIHIPSPYLWSMTTAYEKGKYIEDGVYSPVAVSQQAGVMAILKSLIELLPGEIAKVPTKDAEVAFPKAVPPVAPTPSVTKEAAKSKSVRLLVPTIFGWAADAFFGVGSWISDRFGDVVSILKTAASESDDTIAPFVSLGESLHLNIGRIAIWITIATLVIVAIRHVNDKVALAAATAEPAEEEAA